VRRALLSCFLACAIVGTSGCHRKSKHEATVEIVRMAAVRKDDSGKPVTVDVEIAYRECPGTQFEIVRGGGEFAACVSKHKVGDRVPVSIDHEWSSEGHYRWTVRSIGGCARVRDPDDEASYAMVRECDDWNVNGARVGFQCRYVPEKKLIDKCPWFRRR
jgi:hypothetical protein